MCRAGRVARAGNREGTLTLTPAALNLSDSVQLFATIVTAIATAVLAWFAGVQIWAERRRQESEERVGDARLNANAFQVRQALGALVVESQQSGWTSNDVEALVNGASPLRGRLERALADAAGASPRAADRLRAAFVLFERGLGPFEAYTRGHPPRTAEPLDGGRENLRACCNELERVIEPALLAEAKRLDAWRDV